MAADGEGSVPSGAKRAEGVRWDLSALCANPTTARAALAQSLADASAFQSQYQGRVAGLDAAQLAEVLHVLGQLLGRHQVAVAYCQLRTFADSLQAENQDLRGLADRSDVQFDNLTRFFQLEWQRLDPERARALARADEVAPARHHLHRLTRQAAHTRSAEVEEALAERGTAAESAWQQLFGQTTSAIVADFAAAGPARPHTIDELLSFMDDPRAAVRKRALDTVFAAVEPWTPVLARVYDSLVGDRLVMDRVRGYVGPPPDCAPRPMQQANLANDLADTGVDALLDGVQGHYHLAHRYFGIKARRLGAERLLFYDLYAPVGATLEYPFDAGRQLVLAAVGGFSKVAQRILERCFSEQRIDAEPRRGKQGGAFCEGVALDAPSFLLLNYTDSLRDVQTLAHELGHALHDELASTAQGPFGWQPPLVIAEAASTFQELLLFDHQLAAAHDPETRRGLLFSRIDRSLNTLFAQTMMARYEQRSYATKIAGNSLNPERLTRFWLEEAASYYGEPVELPAGYGTTWARIPHFIQTRFYTYSYSFAHLVSLALYARYLEDRSGFVAAYLDLLGSGGSDTPAEILAQANVDITNPGWVDQGFGLLGSWIDLADQDG